MNIILLLIIALVICTVYIARTTDEDLYTPAILANVYTNTPSFRGYTPSSVAQMWWQPVSYILNPFMGYGTVPYYGW